MKPRLRIKQKITAFTNKYRIYDIGEEGKGGLVSFAQQKRLAFREKVTFYSDEEKTKELFTFRAEKVMDVHGRYYIEDGKGRQLGIFQKVFGKSMLRSTWRLFDADENLLFEVRERSMAVALIRRFGDLLPVGELLQLFMRYHFIFVDLATGEKAGDYRKTTWLRDHYELSMTDEAFESLDWRVYAAISVALDALQSR
jgi:uncharacterized protein YxjI